MNPPIKLIYVVGLGHSGSTLLDLILGSHSSIESVGELKDFGEYFPGEYFPNDRLPREKCICTCGLPANECEYWHKVRSETELICGKSNAELKFNEQKQFEENNYRLMEAILDISGKRIICDSSKSYPRLKKFLNSELFDVFILHLVRDGRAVAFSYKKAGERLKKQGKLLTGQEKSLYGYYKQLWHWQKINIKLHSQFKNLDNYLCIRYEDLVAAPQEYISKILQIINLEFERNQLEFWKFNHHNIDGNRMRVKGKQEIKQDRSYLERLSTKEWRLGTILALPGLKLFNYSIQKPFLRV